MLVALSIMYTYNDVRVHRVYLQVGNVPTVRLYNKYIALGSSVFRDKMEHYHICASCLRMVSVISLLGGLGVEYHQNGVMPLGSSVCRDTDEEQRFM